MLNTKQYAKEIVSMYHEGMSPMEIQRKLEFTYCQPVYNMLQKVGIYEYRKNVRFPRKYSVDETFFDSITTEERAYVLGFICADGSVEASGLRIKILVALQDIDVLQKIAHAMESEHPITVAMRPTPQGKIKPYATIGINSVKLVKQLRSIGLTANKSLTIKGAIFNKVHANMKRHFLRGYFDGDGSIRYGVRYSSGIKYNVRIIGTYDFLVNTYGTLNIVRHTMGKFKSCDMWEWRVSNKEGVARFARYIYEDANIFLSRKYNYVKENMLI